MKSYSNQYGSWTAEERLASLKKTKEAIAKGEIPSQYELGCSICGQRKGRIDYHNENYSHPTKYLKPLCSRCHLLYHSTRSGTTALWRKYMCYVESNPPLPPIKDYDKFFKGIREFKYNGDLQD